MWSDADAFYKTQLQVRRILKLIQQLGKSIYANRWKIRKNMLYSLVFLTYRD